MTEHAEALGKLAQHRALGQAPETEHAWLIANGFPRTYALGETVTKKGEQAANMMVVLSGHIVIRMDRGAGAHKIFEWRAGDVGGVMPYSRGASPPNDAVAEEITETWSVPKEVFPDMIRACPFVTATMVHAMIDRARHFTTAGLRDEKLISLGKLSAGFAHELNNPASALVRTAKLLTESINASEESSRRLGAARLTDQQLAIVDEVHALCSDMSINKTATHAISAMARADKEDAISDWLDNHGLDTACAGPLSETEVTLPMLDLLAENVGASLDAVIQWLSAGCVVRTLSDEIETAASRIHELVGAVKSFSYMDHAPSPEPVDIRRGISDTLTMLGAKVRAKEAEVSLVFADELPRAHAIGAELNQVWMNLIDNALDAIPTRGHLTVSASEELGKVVVRIVDDGPGIPAEIQPRIFDPFFTTKGVGKGTGLGLDIVRRLLQRHEGEVALESVPGRTEFQVRLPAGK